MAGEVVGPCSNPVTKLGPCKELLREQALESGFYSRPDFLRGPPEAPSSTELCQRQAGLRSPCARGNGTTDPSLLVRNKRAAIPMCFQKGTSLLFQEADCFSVWTLWMSLPWNAAYVAGRILTKHFELMHPPATPQMHLIRSAQQLHMVRTGPAAPFFFFLSKREKAGSERH